MKLLHLEDNDSDAELAAAVICREWPDCEITRLATAREFKASLQIENYDLVLSDYTMPGFDGLSALEVVRSTCPDTPFVFLSGTIGEERAVQLMKLGAQDYVIKGNVRRLVPAIERELKEAELRREQLAEARPFQCAGGAALLPDLAFRHKRQHQCDRDRRERLRCVVHAPAVDAPRPVLAGRGRGGPGLRS